MAAFIAQNMAPIMFAALVVFLLLGYPVAFSLGAVGYLSKPVDQEKLIQVLNQYCRRGSQPKVFPAKSNSAIVSTRRGRARTRNRLKGADDSANPDAVRPALRIPWSGRAGLRLRRANSHER